jgi:hypothetical protein
MRGRYLPLVSQYQTLSLPGIGRGLLGDHLSGLKERIPLHLFCAGNNWDHNDFDLISLDQSRYIFTSWPTSGQPRRPQRLLTVARGLFAAAAAVGCLKTAREGFFGRNLAQGNEERMPLQISCQIYN